MTKRHFAQQRGKIARDGSLESDNENQTQENSTNPASEVKSPLSTSQSQQIADSQNSTNEEFPSEEAEEASDSVSESQDESSSESDSASKAPSRPKFVPKSKRSEVTTTVEEKQIIDWSQATSTESVQLIDDTDGSDLKAEYTAWLKRREQRETRDLARMEEQEQEYEERMERKEQSLAKRLSLN